MPTLPQRGTALRRVLTCLLFLPAAAGLACGMTQVTLAWDANAEPGVAGYRLNYGLTSGHYPFQLDVGATTSATIDGLSYQTVYYVIVIAYTGNGIESPPSTELQFETRPPPAPLSIDLVEVDDTSRQKDVVAIEVSGRIGETVRVETSYDLSTWILHSVHTIREKTEIVIIRREPAIRQRFYRVARD